MRVQIELLSNWTKRALEVLEKRAEELK